MDQDEPKYGTYTDLKTEERLLIDAAAAAMKTAYSPYSKFSVGAALLTKDGEIVEGSNVENAAYGSTICAERVALLAANAKGKRNFVAMAIITKPEGGQTETPAAPCGACRQMLFEASQVGGSDIKILLSNTKKDKILITSVRKILPLAFGPADLGVDISKYSKG